MDYLNKAKNLVKDHVVLAGAAVAVAAIAAGYYIFIKPKKYCKNCNAWISSMEENCPYCKKKN
jgi:hypothetical protein